MEIGILYSDRTKVWKPISEIGGFRKDGVLTISLTLERGNRSAQVDGMWSRQNNDRVVNNSAWWGEDYYAIGVMPDGRFFTTQWAENDDKLYARSTTDGSRTGVIDWPRPWPRNADVTIFTGGYLPPAEWEKALEVYRTEMF